jgi:class 3 adenylate cyclase/tetratricopeptide (TPR) repeat protein
MNCPKCYTENREGIKFCEQCGAKMELQCPNCRANIPLGKKFCGECGHNLTVPSEPVRKDLSFDEKLKKIQKYLPKGITEKILAQRDRIEGERKQLTVMFCDMEGFTPLSEKLGPEEMYSLMDQVYEILIHKVHDFDGTVNELTGDGIMALFGAPIALEDAPQRAIRSALAIHREINKFSEQVKGEKKIPSLKMRIGIHTGPVVVGTLGNDLRVDFKAVGDTVNLASRMESLAEPGTTYVSDDTFKLTEGFFRFEALGAKAIKGKEAPVKVYQVISSSAKRTRFDVSAERGLTPFVGRERELELLLDGFERAKAGKGQAFSIVSEAGLGKSRLLYEFRKAVANEDVTFFEGRCLSYSRGVAYHPLLDILKTLFDIQEGDEDLQIREKVRKTLKLMSIEEATTLPYLLELLSVKDSGLDQISMSPEARKDRLMEALKRIVFRGSEFRPLIMAFEDLHWMDKGSEELAKSILESIPGFRVFLIFTYRPQFVHAWGSKTYHSQLTLHRLSNRESLEMATHILGTGEVEKGLEELILNKTEGVPFFIEEFIKSIKDLKIIEKRNGSYRLSKDIQRVTIPSTLQDVIMARVDSLPEAAKEVLQTGSVIEREFSYPLIKRVTGLPEQELLTHLSLLKDGELLYERGIYPDSSYVFRHALTREVVYDSMLAKRRTKRHDEIANAIEELNNDNLREHFEMLAEHYALGENYSKGAEYSRLASRKAEKIASLTDAIAFARKWVVCIERLPRSDEVERQIIDARVLLGLYLAQMHYHVDATQAVGPVFDLARKHNYRKRLAQLSAISGSYLFIVQENYAEAFRALQDALRIAEEVSDVITAVVGNLAFGTALGFNCEFDKGADCLQQALNINLAVNSLWGIVTAKSYLAYHCYFYSGRIGEQLKLTSEAVSVAEESGDIYSKAQAYGIHGASLYGVRSLEEAEKYLLKGIRLCEKIGLHAVNAGGQVCLGEIYFEKGDFLSSSSSFEKGYRVLEENQLFPSWVIVAKAGVARAKVMKKEKNVDLESLFTSSRHIKMRAVEGWMAHYIGDILLNLEHPEAAKAEHWIQKAIEADQRNGTMFRLGLDHALYGEFFKRKGSRTEAMEHLGKSIEILRECGATGWVEKYQKEIETLK